MSNECYADLIKLFEDKPAKKIEENPFSKCFVKVKRDSAKDLTGFVLYTDKVV